MTETDQVEPAPPLLSDVVLQRLAEQVARRAGETVAEAVDRALIERLQRLAPGGSGGGDLADEIMHIGARCAARPVLDSRAADEILGYDEHGLPR